MTLTDPALMKSLAGPGLCGMCLKMCRLREAHHAVSRGHGGGNRIDVEWLLLPLGRSETFECDCHHRIHLGLTTREEVLERLAERWGVEPDDITNAVYVMRRFQNDVSDATVEHELDGQTANVRKLVWQTVERVRERG